MKLLSIASTGVATIVLRRPRHLNRLQREDLATLQAHFKQVASDKSLRVLVLTGTGRVFSAGFDLGSLAQSSESASADPELFAHTVDQLQTLALPTIARLNGSVYGGATDLALACDFRIGVLGMELRMPAARLGLHYYASGMQRYVSRLGLGAAKRLFLMAEAVPAAELLRIGYLDEAVAPEALDAHVERWAQRLASNAPLAVQGMKLSLDEIAAGHFNTEAQRQRRAVCSASSDLAEGVAAFGQRREPQFNGH
jgi:enoyl-CoA hydratase